MELSDKAFSTLTCLRNATWLNVLEAVRELVEYLGGTKEADECNR